MKTSLWREGRSRLTFCRLPFPRLAPSRTSNRVPSPARGRGRRRRESRSTNPFPPSEEIAVSPFRLSRPRLGPPSTDAFPSFVPSFLLRRVSVSSFSRPRARELVHPAGGLLSADDARGLAAGDGGRRGVRARARRLLLLLRRRRLPSPLVEVEVPPGERPSPSRTTTTGTTGHEMREKE